MTTLDHIACIIDAKKDKIHPEICTLLELMDSTGKSLADLRPDLTALRKGKVIHIGPTVNSFYAKIIK